MNIRIVTAKSEKEENSFVDRLVSGDAEAFEVLVNELNPGLIRLARSYFSDAVADEVVQDVWSSVIKSLEKFEGRASLKTWIYRILMNKIRTLGPREARIVTFSDLYGASGNFVDPDKFRNTQLGLGYWSDPPDSWDNIPAEKLESSETVEMIVEIISRLPENQQIVIQLRDVAGWSADQVSEALGITSVNQRVLLHRARNKVRNMLEEFLSNDAE